MNKNIFPLLVTIFLICGCSHNTCLVPQKCTEIMESSQIVSLPTAYIPESDAILLVTIPDGIFQGEDKIEYSRDIYTLSRKDNKLTEIEAENGRTKNSLALPVHLVVNKDTLFFNDIRTHRVSAMRLDGNRLKNIYSINVKRKLKENAFNIIDNKLYTSKSTEGSKLQKSMSVYDIVRDTLFEDSKELETYNHYIDFIKYRNHTNVFYKLYLKKFPDATQPILDMMESITSENAYFDVFTFKFKNKILAVNSYGTEIFEIRGKSERKISDINLCWKLRKADKEIIENNRFKIGPGLTYSQVQRVFSDESENLIMLYYKRKKNIIEASGDSNDYLIIKNISQTGEKSEVQLPIDFFPIYYHQDDKMFYGFRSENGKIYYVEYKLEV